jgi:Zn-dependent protease with chaperone function
MAHELSHIKHNDSLIGGMRIVIEQMFVDLLNLRIKLFNVFIGIANFLRLPSLLAKTLISPIWLLFQITKYSYILIKKAFKLLDLVIQRNIEYRADKEASKAIGSSPGVIVLESLNGRSIEPSFNIFATHPATKKRVEAIRKI